MSNPLERMSLVLEGFPQSGTPKVILLGIALHDGDGGSWPSIPTLARYAAVHERNVQRAIDRLEEQGWLVVHPNAGGTRNTRAHERTNLYQPNYQRLREGVAPAPPGQVGGGADATGGVASSSPRGGADATLTRQEPDANQTRSARAPAAADAPAGSLFPQDDPQPVETLTARIVREAIEGRDRVPLEPLSPRTVGRLLSAGWSEQDLAAALHSAPAWTPSSIQVELTRLTGRSTPPRGNGHRVKDAGNTDTSIYAAMLDGPDERTRP